VALRNGSSGLYDDPYVVNNVQEGDTLYAGKIASSGAWLVLRYVAATGVVDYANRSNNADVSAYADAWTGRAGLTYAAYQTLVGV